MYSPPPRVSNAAPFTIVLLFRSFYFFRHPIERCNLTLFVCLFHPPTRIIISVITFTDTRMLFEDKRVKQRENRQTIFKVNKSSYKTKT